MKHSLLWIITVTLLTLTGKSAGAEVWRIASGSWPPYSSPNIENGGIAVAALRRSLKIIGVQLDIAYMPWPRAKLLAKRPEFDGYFPAWPEEVEEGFAASKPVAMSQIGVIRNQNPLEWSSASNLFNRYKVGFVRTYDYPLGLQALFEKHQAQADANENERELSRTLAAGRIDAAVTDPNVLLHTARELGLTGLVAEKRILYRKPLVVALTKKDGYKRKLALLNQALPLMTLQQLYCCPLLTD
ncbi:substrate-binding periplasmic protein [Roseibium sp.]|uniref:substrate-binding periplasmic protein n=1 Tax=Roseibium sp. TaxID=1936156 RepID=UPI003B523CDF